MLKMQKRKIIDKTSMEKGRHFRIESSCTDEYWRGRKQLCEAKKKKMAAERAGRRKLEGIHDFFFILGEVKV